MTPEQLQENADRERLMARWAEEPRFHLLVEQLGAAAGRGKSLEILSSLRMAERILPVGSHVVAGSDVALIVEGLGGIESGDAGSWPAADRRRAGELAARLRRGAS